MNHQVHDYVSLETLGGGPGKESSAAIELFNVELQKALDNCLDDNTKATATREVTLKVKIKPDDDRESCKVEIHATSKLAPVHPYPTQFFLGKQHGKAVAMEDDPKQRNAFRELEKEKQRQARDKVLPMERKESGE